MYKLLYIIPGIIILGFAAVFIGINLYYFLKGIIYKIINRRRP